MLSAEMLAFQGRAEDALNQVEAQFPAGADLADLEARWKTVRASILRVNGRTQEGLTLLDDAESLATLTDQKSLIPKIKSTRGQLLLSNRPEEAEQELLLALQYRLLQHWCTRLMFV